MFDIIRAHPELLGALGISGGVGGLLGWLIKGIVGGVRAELTEEQKIAQEALVHALSTPDPADDVAATKKLNGIRRLKAIVDALPQPK